MYKLLYVIDSAYTSEGDQKHPGRRNQVAEQLRGFVCDSIKVRDISPSTEVSTDSSIVAVFVHLTDVIEKDYKDLCTFLASVDAPIIAYSGGGTASGEEAKKKLQEKGIQNHWNWFFIQSKLDSPDDFGDYEWRELVNWLLNPSRTLDRGSLPAMISPARNVEYGLSLSLSLLCQGFLAQYALNPANCVHGVVNTKGCADVGSALKAMGWVNEDGSKPEIVKELERQRLTEAVDDGDSGCGEGNHDPSSNSDSELDFWQSPFECGKSLRQGLEVEFRSLRKNAQSKIQNGMLEWTDNATFPSRTAKLVEGIEKAGKTREAQGEVANNTKLFGENFVCVVARAYLELNILLEAA